MRLGSESKLPSPSDSRMTRNLAGSSSSRTMDVLRTAGRRGLALGNEELADAIWCSLWAEPCLLHNRASISTTTRLAAPCTRTPLKGCPGSMVKIASTSGYAVGVVFSDGRFGDQREVKDAVGQGCPW